MHILNQKLTTVYRRFTCKEINRLFDQRCAPHQRSRLIGEDLHIFTNSCSIVEETSTRRCASFSGQLQLNAYTYNGHRSMGDSWQTPATCFFVSVVGYSCPIRRSSKDDVLLRHLLDILLESEAASSDPYSLPLDAGFSYPLYTIASVSKRFEIRLQSLGLFNSFFTAPTSNRFECMKKVLKTR